VALAYSVRLDYGGNHVVYSIIHSNSTVLLSHFSVNAVYLGFSVPAAGLALGLLGTGLDEKAINHFLSFGDFAYRASEDGAGDGSLIGDTLQRG
jgi:hypothetical protein